MGLQLKAFDSLAAFAEHIVSQVAVRHEALQKGLLKGANHIVKEARAEIGHYQPAVGPFPEWEQLAQSTEDDKARKGYPEDAPLYREGTLMTSYKAEVDGLEAIAGSEDPVAFWQEVGTQHIPPREVLGPAFIKTEKKVIKAIGEGYVESLLLQPPT